MRANILLFWFLACVLLVYPFSVLYAAKIYYILVAISVSLLIAIELVRNRGKLVWVIRGSTLFIILHIIFLISTAWSGQPGLEFPELSAILFSIATVILVQYSFSSFDIRKIEAFRLTLFSLFVGLCITEIYLIATFGSVRATNAEDQEVIGSFANLGVTAALLVLIYCFYFYKYRRSMIYLVIMAIASSIIIISQSRVGYVLLFLEICFGFLLMSGKGKKIAYAKVFKSTIAFSIFAVVVFLSSSFLQDTVYNTLLRFNSIDKGFGEIVFGSADNFTRGEADYKRKMHYAAAVEVIKDNPIIGIGYGAFPEYIERNYGVRATVHNIILRTWVDVGVGGVFILFWMFFGLFRKLFRIRRKLLMSGDLITADFYLTTIVMLALLLIQGQFRGMFGDLAFLFFLGIAFSATNMPITLVRTTISAPAGLKSNLNCN